MDAGGLAQMTYNMSLNSGGSLGVPGSGFASRGKGSHIKRLSVPQQQQQQQQQSAGNPAEASPGPRSSRSQLLAGLRTAPKNGSTPATAPIASRMNAGTGPAHDGPAPQAMHSAYHAGNMPNTAVGGPFPNSANNLDARRLNNNRQMYSLPEHVLAPPPIDVATDENGEPVDERLYSELVSANIYLAAQQQRLQQQLASVTAAAQQFQTVNAGVSPAMQQQQAFSPAVFQNPMGYYQQQAQQGMQPVLQPVPGQPGVYSVYNPMTGQQHYVLDDSVREKVEERDAPTTGNLQPRASQQEFGKSPAESAGYAAESTRSEHRRSPPQGQRPPQRSSPPATSAPNPPSHHQQHPQQRQQQQQQQQTPSLPTPMSAGFKRNQKKPTSMAIKVGTDGAGTAGPKSASFPLTPATGTFGPGQARAGEHPIRQPRGPPPLEELVAKPTSKHEGSRNFATRQRRRAVHNLVRAGMERRGGHSSSGGSVTPSSDSDFNFSPTEGEDAGNQSASVSSHPSVGSLRGSNNSSNNLDNVPLGSEKSEKKDGNWYENLQSPADGAPGSFSDEFNNNPNNNNNATKTSLAPTAADVVAGRNGLSSSPPDGESGQRRRMPMFVLSSAEKRRSPNP